MIPFLWSAIALSIHFLYMLHCSVRGKKASQGFVGSLL